ncbi:MAG: 2-oxo acid dehydrogenase subunit E2 [Propionibacteriaceae bacterium]|nr:2-oxo acid dehydrogenase subunit E2 [Propionibacteriaceae bacterium]
MFFCSVRRAVTILTSDRSCDQNIIQKFVRKSDQNVVQRFGQIRGGPFLIRAIVRAVGEQPELNAHMDAQAEVIRQFDGVDVGLATQAPDGLKVPVIRGAEGLDLWETATRIEELSTAVRDGRARPEELTGSTITVTSLGKLGALASTPIVNSPEVAIVGVNRMVVRPLWDGSGFVPRTVMNLSSSFDHRAVDGWEAATFVARLKELLETPALLFVG